VCLRLPDCPELFSWHKSGAVAVADFSGDGTTDLAVCNFAIRRLVMTET